MLDTINEYIARQVEQRDATAAMVTGSFVTGRLGPNSDIDLFFIWSHEYEVMRGREYYRGVEFEYFYSPEWKYYDRMRNDPVSARIYSEGRILLDPGGRMARIQAVARKKAREHAAKARPNDQEERDMKFWLETVRRDGEDLFAAEQYAAFCYFTSTNLGRLCTTLARLRGCVPVYGKYGLEELEDIDPTYAAAVRSFIEVPFDSTDKLARWVSLCSSLENELSFVDMTHYESRQRL